MKASVIIPYFDKVYELKMLLKSLNRQNYKDFEVIIINDGSKDIHMELMDIQLFFDIQYVQFERNEKSGRAFARNRGIDIAKGEICIFVDCDQVVENDFIKKHIDGFEYSDNILQFGTRKALAKVIYSLDEIDTIECKEDSRHQIFRRFNYKINEIEGIWHLVFTHNVSIPRKLIDLYGAFDESFVGWGLEDTEFAYRMKQQGVQIVYNPFVETYDQVESNEINSERRWNEWANNLQLFCEKYNRAEVWCQEVFKNYMNSKRRIALLRAGIEKTWVYCFFQFEAMLKELKNKDNYSQENYLNCLNKKSESERNKEAQDYYNYVLGKSMEEK